MKILCISKKGKLERFVTDPAFYEKYEIVYAGIESTDEEILAAGSDADYIIVDAITPVSAYVIDNMPNLKMIHSEGVAYNGIDLEAANRRHIYVCNSKGMNATAVAEQTVLLMLGVLRDVVNGDKAVKAGRQIDVKTDYMVNGSLKEIADCTIGFIGFGDIARATAKIVNVLGGKVIYYKRNPLTEEEEREFNASYMPLDELLAESDMVNLSVPVTPETFHMADERFFAKMKKGSYLINAGRGELVDSKALLDAIRSGKLAGAGLDTLEDEPIKKDNIMLMAEPEVEDKILMSPHIGGITASSFARGFKMIVNDLAKMEKGEKPDHVVNDWKE